MKVCNQIKKRIDEVESFDVEVERHTTVCADCRRFAEERAALRNLLLSTARVTAPVNFDAVLRARLAEVKARKAASWLNPAVYLRFGMGAAALVVAVFVVQSTGVFPPGAGTQRYLSALVPAPPPLRGQPMPPSLPGSLLAARTDGQVDSYAGVSHELRSGVRVSPARFLARRNSSMPAEAVVMDNGALLLRGRNGESDVTVPAVSVGAQPLVYVSGNRQAQSPRALSASF